MIVCRLFIIIIIIIISLLLYLILIFSRAATNDYFDNRLVGRLFFRLIGLNKIIVFY